MRCYSSEVIMEFADLDDKDEASARAKEARFIEHNRRVLGELAEQKAGQCTPAVPPMTEWPDLRRHFARVLEPLKAHVAGNVSGLDFTISVFGSAGPEAIEKPLCEMLRERKVPVARFAYNAQGRPYDTRAFACENGTAQTIAHPMKP
jgi:hypothetical protein